MKAWKPAPRERGDGVEKRFGGPIPGRPNLRGQGDEEEPGRRTQTEQPARRRRVGTWEPSGRTFGKESMR